MKLTKDSNFMKKISLILLIAAWFGINIGFAQTDNNAEENSTHQFGFAAGASTGYGLSYRYFPGKFGFQVTTTPIISPDYAHLSLGFAGLYTIHQSQRTRFFSYAGYHYNYNSDTYYEYNMNTGNYDREVTSTENTNIFGVGIGIELTAWERVGFNFMSGIGYYYHGSDDWLISLDGGIGVYYKF